MKKIFLTFADSRMHRSLKRIEHQAKEMRVYDEIFICNETNLDPDFRKDFKDKLVPGSRGYGYWCWKPQIILQTLELLSEGDILNYCDAGCHLNKNGRGRLQEYFDMANEDEAGIIAFQGIPPTFHDGRTLYDLKDSKWCKGDLLDYFKVRNDENVINTQTIGATIIFIRKNSKTIDLIKQWCNVFIHDFSLIDDSPSKSPNTIDFIEHRHDQSIFSLLCKINNIRTISAYEYWYPQKNSLIPDWGALKDYPILAKRDRPIESLGSQFVQKILRFSRRFLAK